MSSMELYMPYEVYSNLVIMLTKYRGVTLDAPALTSEMVTRKMNDLEHIVIRGTRENDLYRPDIISVTILIAPESQYATKTADFKKLWNNVPRAQPGKVVNVMFVSDGILTTHLVKVVAAQRAENPALLVEYHDYEIFMLEIPRHINVSPHTLVADKEVDAFCAREYVPRENFPRLTGTDAMAVWLGLTNGMVVKCLRPSDASGSSIVYRIFRA
jgi:DNA-directed RNA polymerase subunit H (RpoH/RPB5)